MDENNRDMPVLFLFVFRVVRLLLSEHQAVANQERSAKNPNSRISAKTKAPAADDHGPSILDHSSQPVVRLATSLDLCPGRHSMVHAGITFALSHCF